MNKLIIGLAGYSGSGKSTFCTIASREYGIPVISTGEFVRNETLRRRLVLSPENIIAVSDQIRAENGGIFMSALRGDIDRALDARGAVLVDCLRELSDYNELAAQPGNKKVVIVSFSASEANRYNRISIRKRGPTPISEDEFRNLTEFEERLGIENLIQIADYKITNNGSASEFEYATLGLLLRIENATGFLLRGRSVASS